jgi:hypothetical protein
LCHDDAYLEVVRAGHFPIALIVEVRMRPAYQNRLDDLDARHRLTHEILAPDEANELEAYQALQGWNRRLGVTIAKTR